MIFVFILVGVALAMFFVWLDHAIADYKVDKAVDWGARMQLAYNVQIVRDHHMLALYQFNRMKAPWVQFGDAIASATEAFGTLGRAIQEGLEESRLGSVPKKKVQRATDPDS